VDAKTDVPSEARLDALRECEGWSGFRSARPSEKKYDGLTSKCVEGAIAVLQAKIGRLKGQVSAGRAQT